MPDINLLLEAEKRGILPQDKLALLNEARSRGLLDKSFLQRLDERKQKRIEELSANADRIVAQGRGVNDFSTNYVNALQLGLGPVADVIGEGISTAINNIPEQLKPSERFKQGLQSLADTKVGRGLKQGANYIGEQYNQLPEDVKQPLEAFGVGAQAVPVGYGSIKGAKIGLEGVENVGSKIKNLSENVISERKNESLKKMALPNLTPTEKAYRSQKGLTESSFGGRLTNYNLDDLEKYGVKVIENNNINVKPYRAADYNAQILDNEIENRSKILTEQIKKRNKTPFDKKELSSRLDEIEASIINNQDIGPDEIPTALKAIENARFLLEKRPEKIFGKDVLEIRRRLDKIMDTKKKADKQNAVLYNSGLRATRDAFNNFLAEKVPTVSVKQLLKEQSGLYAVRDSLTSKVKDDPETLAGLLYSKTLEKIPQRGDVGKVALASGVPAGLLYAGGATVPIVGAGLVGGALGYKAAPYVGKKLGEGLEKISKIATKDLAKKDKITKESLLMLPAPERDIVVDRSGVARKSSDYTAQKAQKAREEFNALGLDSGTRANLSNLEKKDFLKNKTNLNNPLIRFIAENPDAKLQDFYNKDLSEIFNGANKKDWTKVDNLWDNATLTDKQKVIQILDSVDAKNKKKTLGTIINILDKNKNKTELGIKLKEALKNKIKENN